MNQNNLNTKIFPSWCPGCGNFGIWGAFKIIASEMSWDSSNTVIVAGVGCHGHIVNFTKIVSFEGLHGRAIPVAIGIKLANPKLNVFVFTGDGDCLGEGGNHFIHAARRNHDITVIIHDNSLYSLTTGQASPTTPLGAQTKSTPSGNINEPFSPLALAITSGTTFVAREYSSHIKEMASIIKQANAHKGFSVIQALQPCVTFNKVCANEFYQKNTYQLPNSYNPLDKYEALKKSFEWGKGKIPLGIFYKEEKLAYDSKIKNPFKEVPPYNSKRANNPSEFLIGL